MVYCQRNCLEVEVIVEDCSVEEMDVFECCFEGNQT